MGTPPRRMAAASEGETRALILEAANTIQTLQMFIDIQDEMILKDMELKDRA